MLPTAYRLIMTASTTESFSSIKIPQRHTYTGYYRHCLRLGVDQSWLRASGPVHTHPYILQTHQTFNTL